MDWAKLGKKGGPIHRRWAYLLNPILFEILAQCYCSGPCMNSSEDSGLFRQAPGPRSPKPIAIQYWNRNEFRTWFFMHLLSLTIHDRSTNLEA